MTEKLTPEEIKKALECCGTDDGCLRCPLLEINAPECGMRLCRESLELHKSQQAEIERLRTECGNQSALWSKHYEGVFETAKETIKAEAIEEFWGRLKGIAYQSGDWSHGEHPMVVELDDAEEIYDEMVGEQE